jgi:murein DD-endopeptidase MepM/ murein hydrolase activator NlpD
LLPVQYAYISSYYGPRWGRLHQGIDFAAPYGAPIYATNPGKVVFSGWHRGYGRSVVIDHGSGVTTRYAHCARIEVKAGEAVAQGTVIGKVGSTGHSTGPHLHFEVMFNGVRKDPAGYLALKP